MLLNILLHSQLESDGEGSKEADFPMPIEIKNGDFAAENSQFYIRSIIEFDDKDALMSSMEHRDGRPLKARNVLTWPTPRDEVWISRRDILCLIPDLVPTKITASRI